MNDNIQTAEKAFYSNTHSTNTYDNVARGKSYDILKRVIDIVAAASALILLAPLSLYIYIAVKNTGKNVIFGHTRIGRNGVPFKCYKFRSMVEDADKILENLLKTDKKARAEWKKNHKLKNDPRITEIGHFLRKTSLDELPQLWNVLNGTMSIVGPRPITADELIHYGEKAKLYKMVRPGITGIWQVSGRSETTYRKRVALDAAYSAKYNLLWDINIILKTFKVVLKGQGAY